MTAPTRPRRRLPRRVYWVRRFLVLAVLAVVIGTGYWLVSSLADLWRGGDEAELATTAGAEVTATPGAAGPTASPTPSVTPSPAADRRARFGADREPLPEPEGECLDEDVVVAPRVTDAHVGQPIRIVLEVSTRSTPACTWEVSADSVFLKVLRDGEVPEAVWSSQQCPGLMPTAEVVAREQQPAEVVVSWSGQMSDPGCTDQPGWVRTGQYEAVSVARGAVKPKEFAFELGEAVPEVVVLPPTPSAEADQPADEPAEDR